MSASEPAINQENAFLHVLRLIVDSKGDQIIDLNPGGLKCRSNEGYPLGKPPYGWRTQDSRLLPRGKRCGIEPVPERAKIVRQIWEWFAAGLSSADIARKLTEMGVCSPGGKSRWRSRTIRDMLRNPVHAGLIRINGKYVRGVHFDDRIIDESEFHAGQERLRNDRTGRHKP